MLYHSHYTINKICCHEDDKVRCDQKKQVHADSCNRSFHYSAQVSFFVVVVQYDVLQGLEEDMCPNVKVKKTGFDSCQKFLTTTPDKKDYYEVFD